MADSAAEPRILQWSTAPAATTSVQDGKIIKYDFYEEPPFKRQILPEEIRKLFEDYSKISNDRIIPHIVAARDRAWVRFPYPCIGSFMFSFMFLDPSFVEIPDGFDEIVERLGAGQKLLDMGCCFGQTIRELVAGGAPSNNFHGCHREPEFIEQGYSLFNDRRTLQTEFLLADIFDEDSTLSRLWGQVDNVHCGLFLYLGPLTKQIALSKAVSKLLRPVKGSMIVGRQVGRTPGDEGQGPNGPMFQHDPSSFTKIWNDIGKEMGCKYTVKAKLVPYSNSDVWHMPGTGRLWFSIRRE